ncbi:MAG: hypothetical protein AB8F95_06570 [Bacteroidia bacterium]
MTPIYLPACLITILLSLTSFLLGQNDPDQHRFSLEGKPAFLVEACTNAQGWTGAIVVEAADRNFRIFDKDWKLLVSHKAPNERYRPSKQGALSSFVFSDETRFGFLEYSEMRPSVLTVITPLNSTKTDTAYTIDIFQENQKKLWKQIIGQFKENGELHLLWTKNENSTEVRETIINLDGETRYQSYVPSEKTHKHNKFKFSKLETGQNIMFLDDRNLFPSDPYNGLRANRMTRFEGDSWLIVDHVKRLMAQDHHTYITQLDEENGTSYSFYLPFDGTSFIQGDSLFLFDLDQDFNVYRFSIKIFSMHDIKLKNKEATPIFEKTFDSKDEPKFPIPYQAMKQYKFQKGNYVLHDSIVHTETKGILDACIKVNSRPFFTLEPQGDSYAIKLGLISFSEGGAFIPLPVVSVTVFYKVVGKQIWALDLNMNTQSGDFFKKEHVPPTEWERYLQMIDSIGEKQKEMSFIANIFKRSDGWYVVYQDVYAQELVFRKL